MGHCQIDASGAGRFAHALEEGAGQFCKKHPQENWTISGVCGQAFTLNATDGTRSLTAQPVAPEIDMADAIFKVLEDFGSADHG
jgi:hypothetical protein